MPSVTAPPRAGHDKFYLDQLDVLRGLAVLAVVAFHARLPWSSAGFIGVDVFFVLSGFLITRLLVVELERTGTIRWQAFEARRVRRLWPALALVVVATIGLGMLVWSPLEWRGLMHDAAAGATYVANVAFAQRDVGYFDQPLEESPYLHLWSLGVEEQFYVVWPLLLVGAAWLARRLRLNGQRTLATAIAGLGVLSLVLMISLVHRRNPHVFFLTPARLWELAAGGLIGLRAVSPPTGSAKWPGRLYVALGLVPFVALLAFPALRAAEPLLETIAPVVGTALLLEGIRRGSRLPVPAAVAGVLAWIGWYSYGWYLWHWPFVAAVKVWSHTDDRSYLLAASALALVAAVGSKRWLEDPIRFRQPESSLGRVPTWGVMVGAIGVVAVALAANRVLRHVAFENPQVRALAAVQADLDGRDIMARCPNSPYNDGCVLGDPTSRRVLVVAGDSHAAQWLPALDSVGRVLGVKVVPHVRPACPPQPVRLWHEPDASGDESEDLACEQHERRLLGTLIAYDATALVLASASGGEDRMLGTVTPDQRREAWTQSLAHLLKSVPPKVRVILVQKSPELGFDPVDCLARSAFWSIRPACDASFSRAAPLALEDSRLEVEAATGDAQVRVFPTISPLCPAQMCRAVSGSVVVFRNEGHLAPRYTAMQAGRWLPYVRWAMGLDSVTEAGR
ncbi:MAG TPA: acyltransferase family protein [Gemmatimonadales bacterium]|nr:acyltransferase family protein [Gemmatimonadales bacterium]